MAPADPAAGKTRVTVNYLIPDKSDVALPASETFVAGVNHIGLCGEYRQNMIAKLRVGEPIYLVRVPDHPNDPNAVVLFSSAGKDIGYLPRDVAAAISPRLDAGSPVTATVERVESFGASRGRALLGVRLLLVRYRPQAKAKQ
jgi:HIRAN domain